ncbi:MAG: MptD family putative ECF transporter S component [Actinomycetaceae bacterium]|nr:MptD family putative ECF transporter S component [Actinomycetaceae bacterium]
MKFSLTTRDYINIGVFTVLYFVVFFVAGMFGLISPGAIFLGWVVGIILDGIVIVFLLARSPKMGVLTLLGLFVALLMMLTGHPSLVLLTPVFGFIADIVASERGFAEELQPKRAIIAYAILSLWFATPLLPIFYASDSYFEHLGEQVTPDYLEGMKAIFTPTTISIWAVCIVVLGLAGGWLGTKVARKHFDKAGLTR